MLTPHKEIRDGNPLWRCYACPQIPTAKLDRDRKTDVVIIGAGISGAMAAEAISGAGFKVIMLDCRGPLMGATSASTALLQYEIDTPLIHLQKQIGYDKAMRAWRRSKLALESLTAIIQGLDIKCEMKRSSSLYLAGNTMNAEALKEEGQARNIIGIHTDYCTRDQLREHYGIRRNAALLSFENLTANPLKLAAGFIWRALENKAELFAPVTANEVETHRDHVVVHTKDGPTVTARYLVYATGYEIPKTIHTKRHSLHSTYAIATKPQRDKLWRNQSLIWEASDPYLYLRTTRDGRVICGGGDEDFENTDKRDALMHSKTRYLEKKLKDLFPQLDTKAEYAWCGSFGASKTGLPTIGAVPGMKNCFAIMAYGGNGITFSRIAAEVLSAHLKGKADPDADLFEFS